MNQKVFVSGSFDMLHSGHIEFFREAAQYGDLYVALGSDKTIFELKGRSTVNNERERLFVVKSVSFVKDAFISRGSGILDFEAELHEIMPDYFIVNADGHTAEKRDLCRSLGTQYVILERKPHPGFEARSTTQLRQRNYMPYRIDLAGGWHDQPFVSKHYPGSVITISLEPTLEFNERSGMASSTRRHAQELWGPKSHTEITKKSLECFFVTIILLEQKLFQVHRIRLAWCFRAWQKHIMKANTGPRTLNIDRKNLFCILSKARSIWFRLDRVLLITMFWRILLSIGNAPRRWLTLRKIIGRQFLIRMLSVLEKPCVKVLKLRWLCFLT
jgi:cytidyltransferase-like protein